MLSHLNGHLKITHRIYQMQIPRFLYHPTPPRLLIGWVWNRAWESIYLISSTQVVQPLPISDQIPEIHSSPTMVNFRKHCLNLLLGAF